MSNRNLKIKGAVGDIPTELSEDIVEIVKRIVSDPNVLGVLYFRDNIVQMCTVPHSMVRPLCSRLPKLSEKIFQSVIEIDVLDELIAYRIGSLTSEIMVVGGKDIGACVVQKQRNKTKQKRHPNQKKLNK